MILLMNECVWIVVRRPPSVVRSRVCVCASECYLHIFLVCHFASGNLHVINNLYFARVKTMYVCTGDRCVACRYILLAERVQWCSVVFHNTTNGSKWNSFRKTSERMEKTEKKKKMTTTTSKRRSKRKEIYAGTLTDWDWLKAKIKIRSVSKNIPLTKLGI